MISLQRCRQILKKSGLAGIDEMTDEKLSDLRAKLYELAELQVEEEELQARDRRPGSVRFYI